MSGIPPLVRQRIEARLSAIAAEFQPGAKLTLLVRNDVGPGKDGDAVFTNDNLEEAISGLRRRSLQEGAGT